MLAVLGGKQPANPLHKALSKQASTAQSSPGGNKPSQRALTHPTRKRYHATTAHPFTSATQQRRPGRAAAAAMPPSPPPPLPLGAAAGSAAAGGSPAGTPGDSLAELWEAQEETADAVQLVAEEVERRESEQSQVWVAEE